MAATDGSSRRDILPRGLCLGQSSQTVRQQSDELRTPSLETDSTSWYGAHHYIHYSLHSHYITDHSATLLDLASAALAAGDAVMTRLWSYVKDDGGRIDEQIDKNTGLPCPNWTV